MLTPERAAPTLAGTTRRRALRVQLSAQHRRQVADKFELSSAEDFLCRDRRLVGGGNSHQRTILHGRFPVIQGKYREFSRFRGLSATMDRRKDVYSLAFLIEFPTQPNREIFRRNRELIRRNREFSFDISETLKRCMARRRRSNGRDIHRRSPRKG
jgi:hypothetical protein